MAKPLGDKKSAKQTNLRPVASVAPHFIEGVKHQYENLKGREGDMQPSQTGRGGGGGTNVMIDSVFF